MGANLLLMAVLFGSISATVIVVVLFRFWRKKMERRSPLQDRQAGHVPGQQLVTRLGDSEDKMLLSVIIMYFAFPIMLLAWALSRLPPERMRFDSYAWMFMGGGGMLFAWGMFDYVRHWKHRQAAKDGLLAERVTGMQLNRLVAQGCLVLHDLPADGFNIDHVVITPRAVYAVETKSFRKPREAVDGANYRVSFDGRVLKFPDFTELAAVEQAQRYASWLERVLRDAHFDVPVVPSLALPGWLVVQSDDTWRSSKVKVFSPMGNGANFMAKDMDRINLAKRSQIAQVLALRYPKLDG